MYVQVLLFTAGALAVGIRAYLSLFVGVIFLLAAGFVALFMSINRQTQARLAFMLGWETWKRSVRKTSLLETLLPPAISEQLRTHDPEVFNGVEFKHVTMLFCSFHPSFTGVELDSAQWVFDQMNPIVQVSLSAPAQSAGVGWQISTPRVVGCAISL